VAALLAGGFFVSTLAALALAALSGLCLVAAFRGLARPSVGVVALGFVTLWTAASFLWNGSDSLRAALLPLLYASALWLAEQGDRRVSLGVLRVAILIVALLALGGRALGLAPTAGASSERLQWPVTYANGLGLIAATGVLLWLGLPARRPWAARAAAGACGLVLVLTFSRGAAIGLLVGATVLLLLAGRIPRRGALAAAGVAVAAALLAGPAIVSHFSASSPDSRDARRFFDLSGNGRARIWHEAWRKARSHPVVGIGPGSFRSRIGGSSAHSLELQSLVDLGLVGLLGIAVFLVAGVQAVRGSPVAAAVFALWLVVASIDWVWQLPACTLPALLAAAGGSVRRVG
jgi:O-antigen ligase